jgi:hypothetical protein
VSDDALIAAGVPIIAIFVVGFAALILAAWYSERRRRRRP